MLVPERRLVIGPLSSSSDRGPNRTHKWSQAKPVKAAGFSTVDGGASAHAGSQEASDRGAHIQLHMSGLTEGPPLKLKRDATAPEAGPRLIRRRSRLDDTLLQQRESRRQRAPAHTHTHTHTHTQRQQ
ncbi:uncharacterized protein V6R79_023182 [Siganus canaliculatus]